MLQIYKLSQQHSVAVTTAVLYTIESNQKNALTPVARVRYYVIVAYNVHARSADLQM